MTFEGGEARFLRRDDPDALDLSSIGSIFSAASAWVVIRCKKASSGV